MQPLSIVILAAGQGKRMRSALPKVLAPLAGRPLLAHVMRTAQALKPKQICVVYGHGGEAVRRAFEHERLEWVHQAQQLGTGHALMQAMPCIPDGHTVLVLYGDVPLIGELSLRKLLAAAGAGGLAVLSVELEDPAGYGRIVRDTSGKFRSIVEHKDANEAQLAIREVNSGLLAAPARKLRAWLAGVGRDNAQREYYLTDVVAGAAGAGEQVAAVLAADAGEVLGVNDRLQLAAVEDRYRRRRAEELMLAGATLADPSRIDVRGEVEVHADVFIDVNVVLAGEVRLGRGVSIGPNCYVRDAIIGEGTLVHANCVIDHAHIGADCRIGPFAHLRPDSTLRAGVHIGNFVEVKNSDIGPGSKANHLTYVGDATVGKDVNIGAGTITCNYDGANKWPTAIEDGAFIGSGSMLVAPVRVGARSTIGAGSTITRNAPAGKLTLTRAAQSTLPEWRRPRKLDPKARAAAARHALARTQKKAPAEAARAKAKIKVKTKPRKS